MRTATDVECRGLWIVPEADRAILVSGAGDWQALAEIRVLRQKMRLAAEMIQQVSKLACQDLVR